MVKLDRLTRLKIFFSVRERSSFEGVWVRVESWQPEALRLEIRAEQAAQVQDQGEIDHLIGFKDTEARV